MSADPATLDFYTTEARVYADYVASEAAHPRLADFAGRIAPGGTILDFGCGPAWAANAFRQMGYDAQGFDGSPGLAAEARRRYDIDVTVGAFETFDAVDAYDGIWASFCLLHDSREAMPGHLARLYRALRPGGVLYVGLKEGDGAERDDLGRLYTYFSQAEMTGWLGALGFSAPEIETEPSTGYSGMPCTSLHIITRRAR